MGDRSLGDDESVGALRWDRRFPHLPRFASYPSTFLVHTLV